MNTSRIALLSSLLLFNSVFCVEVFGQHSVLSKSEITRRARENKARLAREKRLKENPAYQRKLAIEKQKRERQQRAKDLRRSQRSRAKTNQLKHAVSTKTLNIVRATAPARPNFDAAQAGRPARTLAKFIHTAKSARSINQLLPYLTQAEQKSIAASTRRHRQENGKTKLSPGDTKVQFYSALANDILSVRSEKVTGNTAKLWVVVRRDAEVNGQKHDRGLAIFKMKGEGSSWRFVGFSSEDEVFSSSGEML